MRTIFIGILLSSYLLFSCTSTKKEAVKTQDTHSHDDHDHAHDDHDHSHDDHDHAHGDHDDAHDDHDHEEELEEGEVALSAKQFQLLGLEMKTVAPGPFNEIIKTSGQLVTPLGEEVVLVARNNGLVNFSKKNLTLGSKVGRGEKIAEVSSKNLAEGDVFTKNKLQFELAQQELNRAETLIKDSLISRTAYNQIKANYENAKVNYDALAQNGSANGIPILGSIDGYIKDILVEDGAYVTSGQAIATLTSNRRIQLQADVPEKYASVIPTISTANFKTADGKTHYSLSDLNGRLISYGRSLNAASSQLPISFEFDNAGSFLSGSYVEVYLKTTAKEVITLPLTALIEEQGLFFVFTKRKDNVYYKQPIKKGADDGAFVEILSGIAQGDEVVTKGAYYLKMASMNAAIPHGHAH